MDVLGFTRRILARNEFLHVSQRDHRVQDQRHVRFGEGKQWQAQTVPGLVEGCHAALVFVDRVRGLLRVVLGGSLRQLEREILRHPKEPVRQLVQQIGEPNDRRQERDFLVRLSLTLLHTGTAQAALRCETNLRRPDTEMARDHLHQQFVHRGIEQFVR